MKHIFFLNVFIITKTIFIYTLDYNRLMIFLFILEYVYSSRPAILNFNDYVVAYSPSNDSLSDIKKFMNNNDLPFFDVSIDSVTDVREFYDSVYKDRKARVFYYGSYLGTFEDFKKKVEKERVKKEKEKIKEENLRGLSKVRHRSLINRDAIIWTNDLNLVEN